MTGHSSLIVASYGGPSMAIGEQHQVSFLATIEMHELFVCVYVDPGLHRSYSVSSQLSTVNFCRPLPTSVLTTYARYFLSVYVVAIYSLVSGWQLPEEHDLTTYIWFHITNDKWPNYSTSSSWEHWSQRCDHQVSMDWHSQYYLNLHCSTYFCWKTTIYIGLLAVIWALKDTVWSNYDVNNNLICACIY